MVDELEQRRQRRAERKFAPRVERALATLVLAEQVLLQALADLAEMEATGADDVELVLDLDMVDAALQALDRAITRCEVLGLERGRDFQLNPITLEAICKLT